MKKLSTRIIAILLMAGLMTGIGFSPIQANGEATAEFENGQYLYFGRYTGEQLKWRGMEVDETNKTATLLLDDVLKDNLGNIPSISYDPTATNWQDSLICEWLNVTDFLTGIYVAEQNFNELEKESILPYSSDTGFDQKIVLPSFTELGGQNDVVPGVGEGTRWPSMPLTDAGSAGAAPGRTVPSSVQYHTRSIYHASGTSDESWMVDNDGALYSSNISNDYRIRPSCKIDLRAVFSKSGGGTDSEPYDLGFVGEYVEFGQYKGSPILWQIMASDDVSNSITLMTDSVVEDNPPFHNELTSITWMCSDVCSWLNEDGDGFLNGEVMDSSTSNFTPEEMKAILPYDTGAPAYNQKIVLPSYTELGGTGGVVPLYGQGVKWIHMPNTVENSEVRVASNNKAYWTRSIAASNGYSNSAWLVSMYGALNSRGVSTAGMGVRPVCKIDLQSVDFTTGLGIAEYPYALEAKDIFPDISGDFTDANFKQSIWEWLGNTGAPGAFSQQDLIDRMEMKNYTLNVEFKGITSLTGLEHFEGTGLEEFQCNANDLTSLPTLPTSLTTLHCYNNELIGLPTLPEGLIMLNCGSNQLTSLPALPTSLTNIYSGNNQLSSSPTLPDGLKGLNFGNNELTSLPVLPISLTSLRCENNQLSSLPDLPDSLELMSCGFNLLTSLPVLPVNLEYLYCNNNQLVSLPTLPDSLLGFQCNNNYINVFTGALEEMISNCSAGSKTIMPQYRYTYTGAEILMLPTENRQLTSSELKRQQSEDGSVWTNSVNADLSDLSFSSSSEAVAVVSSSGRITAQSEGNCVVYAKYNNIDSEFTTASIPVLVTALVSDQISATATDNSIVMAAGNTTLSDDNFWTINIGNSTVADSVYMGDLSVSNLPEGLIFNAEKGAGNTVTAAVYGMANSPVDVQVAVGIIIKGSAVTNPDALDSNIVTVYINPYDTEEDNTLPTAPGNLRITNRTSSAVAIAWDASNDESGIAKYRVQRKMDGGNYADIGNTSGTTFQDTGLNPSTTYTYQVRAEDISSNSNLSGWSAPLTVTTLSSGSSNDPSSRDRTSSTVPRVDWGRVKDELMKSETGKTITVKMNGETTIPASILDTYRGKNINLVLDMGNGITWTINGKTIKAVPAGYNSYNLGVRPVGQNDLSSLTEGNDVLQLELAHNGSFPFTAVLNITVGKEYEGKILHMNYFNQTANQLEYRASSKIDNEGMGHFIFASASRYVITTKIIKGSKVRANLDMGAADGHSFVPYFKNNGVETIVALSAVIDDLMYFTAPQTAEYDYKENEKSFNDTMNHWAKDEISFATARNLFSEIGSGVFAPDTPTTRGMFVAALGRLLNIDISSFKALRFNDVKGGDYYAPYVEWAAESGIVIGTGEDLFAPDKAITREEMAAIVDRYAKFAGFELKAINANTAPFIDEIQIGAWAKGAVKVMQKSGILSGKPGNLFDPKGTATRAEASTILRRIIISIVK